MTQRSLASESRKASTQAVNFTDGMLVTAEDLGAAMHYPLGVLQVLARSYFGCGIVCGLDLELTKPPPAAQQGGYGASESEGSAPPATPNFVLLVKSGVALDCAGLPIELCDTVKLDLSR